MNCMSSICQDFVASNLRSQVNRLNAVLNNIEDHGSIDCDYTHESLKDIEIKLRQIRKLCVNN